MMSLLCRWCARAATPWQLWPTTQRRRTPRSAAGGTRPSSSPCSPPGERGGAFPGSWREPSFPRGFPWHLSQGSSERIAPPCPRNPFLPTRAPSVVRLGIGMLHGLQRVGSERQTCQQSGCIQPCLSRAIRPYAVQQKLCFIMHALVGIGGPGRPCVVQDAWRLHLRMTSCHMLLTGADYPRPVFSRLTLAHSHIRTKYDRSLTSASRADRTTGLQRGFPPMPHAVLRNSAAPSGSGQAFSVPRGPQRLVDNIRRSTPLARRLSGSSFLNSQNAHALGEHFFGLRLLLS